MNKICILCICLASKAKLGWCQASKYILFRYMISLKEVTSFHEKSRSIYRCQGALIWPGCPSIPLNIQYRGQWNECPLLGLSKINILCALACVILINCMSFLNITNCYLNSEYDEYSLLKFNESLLGPKMLGLFTANTAKYTVVQRDESFYVCCFLCHMGVTQVNDLHAILPINPCHVFLHPGSIP